MTTLRILLLLVGAAFIVGVWWWSRREQRVRGAIPSRRVERLPPQPGVSVERGPTEEEDEDLDIAATLADLSGLMREGRNERARRSTEDAGAEGRRRAVRARPPHQLDMGFANEPTAESAALQLPERIIALYVQAPAGGNFDGPSIAAAFAAVNMHFGEMSIFHHYGVGGMQSSTPMFSAANMFEPGSFDLSVLHSVSTHGLAFFMRLPGSFEASLAFELMLSTVQRIARELHGEVLDDTRALLSSHSIEQLRTLVKQYDRA